MNELLKANDDEKENIRISANSSHKAEDIELLDEEEMAKKYSDPGPFPELDELEKIVQKYEEPVASSISTNPWHLPEELQKSIIAKMTVSLFSVHGFTVLHGYLGFFHVRQVNGQYRFLLSKQDVGKLFELYAGFSGKSTKKSLEKKAKSKVLKQFLGLNKTARPVNGIKSKKSFEYAETLGLRLSEIRAQFVAGNRTVIKSPWSYAGLGKKTHPQWKIENFSCEPTGEEHFVWVDVSYSS